jgi:ubiquinol-cytochrome c reductase cytochrome b subunit
MFRGLMYGSYRAPRELVWIVGMAIYLVLMGEAFFGYLLPWGQMSYWGAQVIVNLFDALPLIGPDLALWIRGDYVVSDATLNRFFAFHIIAMPLVLIALVAVHILALHEVGSNNPDGVEIKKNVDAAGHPVDGIPFHPYYTVKDLQGAIVFLAVFALVLFFMPEFGGYFLEYNNFIPADPLKTPSHIAPVWYFTPFYSILRATTSDFMWVLGAAAIGMGILIARRPAGTRFRIATAAVVLLLLAGFFFVDPKVWGVVLMGAAVLIYFFLPWLDRSPVKSIRYKGRLYRIALAVFVIAFVVLGYFGTEPVTPVGTFISQLCTVLYFAFFALMPWYSRLDKARPEPVRVTR